MRHQDEGDRYAAKVMERNARLRDPGRGFGRMTLARSLLWRVACRTTRRGSTRWGQWDSRVVRPDFAQVSPSHGPRESRAPLDKLARRNLVPCRLASGGETVSL